MFISGGLLDYAFGYGIVVSRTVTVCRFGSPIARGTWVQIGSPSVGTWIRSGMAEYVSYPVWKASAEILENVPKSVLRWPSGWEWLKGFLGQQIYWS